MNKKGFTLIELLAVIVVLALILVIASPKIGNSLNASKERTFKINVEQAIKLAKLHYQQNFGGKQNSTPVTYKVENNKITQNDVDIDLSTGISDMTGSILVNADGDAKVTLQNDEFCVTKSFNGTLIVSELSEGRCAASTVEDYFLAKVGTDGLIVDDHLDLRYQGSNSSDSGVNNYVTFNDETAGWRIVGLFDVDGVKRIKLIKVASIGSYAWDRGVAGVNDKKGVNEWSQSSLKAMLNDYYYNGVTNGTCYISGEEESCSFAGLTVTAKSLIGDATWYLGGVADADISLSDMYSSERGTIHVTNPSDGVTRTNTWRGKIGLIYASDARYASPIGNSFVDSCQSILDDFLQCNGWIKGLTITSLSTNGYDVIHAISGGYTSSNSASPAGYSVHPSVYLIPDVKVSGSGTTSDPYVFTK